MRDGYAACDCEDITAEISVAEHTDKTDVCSAQVRMRGEGRIWTFANADEVDVVGRVNCEAHNRVRVALFA